MTQNLAPGPSTQLIGATLTQAQAGASYANTVGTITTASSAVTTGNIGLAGNVTIYMYGTYAGVTAVFEISFDNTNWFPVAATREDSAISESTTGPLPANTVRAWTTGAPGFAFVRVRATAYTSGTANVVIVAGTYAFEPMVSATTRKRQSLATYTAGYRAANATAGARVLAPAALTANTNKQFATIYHAASATKRVQIKFVSVNLHGNSVAGNIEFELVTLSATTAPATGNPAITPGKHDQADAAAEATCLALPTTAGSVVDADRPVGDNWEASLGVTGTGSTAAPPPAAAKIVLWDSRADGDGKDLIIRAGVAEGYAINARSSAASGLTFTAVIIFTEE